MYMYTCKSGPMARNTSYADQEFEPALYIPVKFFPKTNIVLNIRIAVLCPKLMHAC